MFSASGDLAYNSTTGDFSISASDSAQHTSAEIRLMFSASGDLAYNSTTGGFSVTTYKTANFTTDFGNKSTSDLSEGTNLYYTVVRVDSDIDAFYADASDGTVQTGFNADKVDGYDGIAVYDRTGTLLN
jgi:hypothetical protein